MQKISNILVILADTYHYKREADSIARKACTTYCKTCIEAGHEVDFVDLYKEYKNKRFDPIFNHDNDPNEVLNYQVKVKTANKIVVFYPTVWGSMPALMKGFVDSVFIQDFGFVNQGIFVKNKPKLEGKSAEVFVFESQDWASFKINGNNFDQVFWERSVFGRSGIATKFKPFYNTGHLNMDSFDKLIEQIKKSAAEVATQGLIRQSVWG